MDHELSGSPEAAETDLNKLREAHNGPSDQAAAPQARLLDQEVDLKNRDTDRELLLQDLAKARKALAAQYAELEELVARQVEAMARRDLMKSVEVKRLEAQDQELAQLRSSLTARFEELGQLTRRCEAQQREVQTLRRQLNAITTSTSWWLLAPARRVITLIRPR